MSNGPVSVISTNLIVLDSPEFSKQIKSTILFWLISSVSHIGISGYSSGKDSDENNNVPKIAINKLIIGFNCLINPKCLQIYENSTVYTSVTSIKLWLTSRK